MKPPDNPHRETSAPGYRKLVYWVEAAQTRCLEDYARQKGKRLYRARRRPCEVLFHRRELCMCAPEVWSRDCRRQGSWYRESDKAGKFLVVSNFPLDDLADFADRLECVIGIVRFHPPRRASREDAERLMNHPEFKSVVPAGWFDLTDEERKNIRRYLDSKGIADSVDEVFKFYTANHANFIVLDFHIDEGGEKIPYSIADEPYVCSACVELFGVLGIPSAKGYLMKCAGLFYVELGEGEWLCVEQRRRLVGK
ncbi:MAG: hypothetical protein DRP79_05555 [Planctomycetota bacterium]|nr:MAG: hypothetical protein DRP79_05555 [Planctomycetota bacterium]